MVPRFGSRHWEWNFLDLVGEGLGLLKVVDSCCFVEALGSFSAVEQGADLDTCDWFVSAENRGIVVPFR